MRRIDVEQRAVALVFAAHGATSGTFASRVPWIADRLHLSSGRLGIAFLMASIGGIATVPFSGRMVKRLGVATAARLLMCCYIASVVVISWMPNLWTLGVAMALSGAAGGTADMAMNSQGILVEKRLGRPIISGLHGLWSAGVLVAATVGSAVAKAHVDARAHFAVVLAINALVALYAVGKFRTTLADVGGEDPAEAERKTPLWVIPRGRILFIGLVGFCGIFPEIAGQDWSAVYMHRQLGTSEATAALTTGMFAVTMVIGRLSGNAVVRRFGAAAVVRACGVIGALGAVLIATAHATVPAVIGFMMVGAGVSVVVPLAFAAAGHAGPDPTLGMAGVATVAYGAGLIAPGLIGGVADATSLRIAFCVVAVLAGLIAAGGGLLGRVGAELGAAPGADAGDASAATAALTVAEADLATGSGSPAA